MTHIEAFNRSAQTLFGYPEDEALNRNVSILVPSPHQEGNADREPYVSTGDPRTVVIQNLLINSAYAMQGNGRIRVAVEVADTTCHLAFADGGAGVPPDVRDKIFMPFFTTRSRGSALGLPTVKRFVEGARFGAIRRRLREGVPRPRRGSSRRTAIRSVRGSLRREPPSLCIPASRSPRRGADR
jgi:signal transduction histidine kinase